MASASFKESKASNEDCDSSDSEFELLDFNQSELGIDQNNGGQNRTETINFRLIDVAMEGEDVGLEQLLQERDPSILHQLTPLGDTLLHLAAKFGLKRLLLEICDRCPSLLTKRNQCGNIPLHVGARAGQLNVVRHLIDKMTSSPSSVDVNVEHGTTRAFYLLGSQNHKGDTALHEALRYCRCTVAKLLIRKDPDLCRRVNRVNESPLFLAVIKGYLDVVHTILHFSPSPACGGPKGWTALHASTMVNNEFIGSYITEKLLQVKPELARVKDINGKTPLHYAVEMKNASIVRLLLQLDASLVYVQDNFGLSVLHVAASRSDLEYLEMTNIDENIIQYSHDLEYLVDCRGNNVLHTLIIRRIDSEPFKSEFFWIFALQEFLNQPNYDGNTPLHLATICRKEHFGRFLAKDSRVDKKARNNNNQTAYDIAYLEYRKSLREKGKSCRAWERMKLYVDPYNQYFLRDKSLLQIEALKLDVEGIVQQDDERDAKKQEEHEHAKEDVLMAVMVAVLAFVTALQMPKSLATIGALSACLICNGAYLHAPKNFDDDFVRTAEPRNFRLIDVAKEGEAVGLEQLLLERDLASILHDYIN
ncbi:hypothetical protein NE237_003643 [Protea cynaroides]|uniref:Uncharacterized protein n=1 Tax=Protea cynaroides TaxID=273540 RepID=A0A9Q0QSX6_9MAGN|nr:hypothetical protein NE237_003643 [Protea cynaroides]